jgi:hypothetical protein
MNNLRQYASSLLSPQSSSPSQNQNFCTHLPFLQAFSFGSHSKIVEKILYIRILCFYCVSQCLLPDDELL